MVTKGRPKCEEHKAKLRGANSPFWRGGRASEVRVAREQADYKLWRKQVFERDHYACQHCGQKGRVLNADHKMPFSLLPKYMRLDLNNGRTLCIACHRKTPTYGNGTNELRKKLEKVYGDSKISGQSQGSSKSFTWK